MTRDFSPAIATGALIGGIITLALSAWVAAAVCFGVSGIIAWVSK